MGKQKVEIGKHMVRGKRGVVEKLYAKGNF